MAKGSSVSDVVVNDTATSLSAEQEVKSVRLNEIKEAESGLVSDKSMSEVGKSAEHTIEGIIPETLTSLPQPSSLSPSAEIIKVSEEKEEEMSEQKLSNDFSLTSAIAKKIDGSVGSEKTSVTTLPFQTTSFGHGKLLF